MKLPAWNPNRTHLSVDLLSAYLDGQVTAAERARIEEHLPTCPACQRELNSLRQTVTLLHAMPRVPLPRAFILSEVQVGIHRPVSRLAWHRGALSGLAAVTAIALVAIVAITLLRQPTRNPSETIARVVPAAPAPAAQPSAAPTEAVKALVVEKAATEVTAVVEAPTATAAPAAAQKAAPVAQPVQPTETAAASEVVPTPTPTPEVEAPLMARAAQPALPTPAATPAPAADVTPAVMPMAAPQETRGIAAAAFGRGGGIGGGEAAAPPSEALTPEPAPPLKAIGDVFPALAGMAYADRQSLWAIDRESGVRELVKSPGVTGPLISPDGQWIAYRVEGPTQTEIWAVRWEGGDAHLLLTEGELPKDGLGENYTGRRILAVRWVPGRNELALTTTALPAVPEAMPKVELWNLDVETGALRYILDMGQVDRPLYAPDGAQFVLLRYGTGDSHQGSLTLFNADGTGGQELLSFPAGPNVFSFESQVSWLPDSSGLWVAIPDSTLDLAPSPSAVTLYRVPVGGGAEAVAHLDGLETFWSPDGTRLAYFRASPDTPEMRELLLANADGSNPEPYTSFRDGTFGGWSPDSKHFLYYADQYVYVGTPSQAPQRLGNSVSVIDPRWVSSSQMLHFLNTSTGWMLVLRTLDGDVASLETLPRDISYDVHGF
jgi:hypothetical protein